jgi:hypothetical protein
MEKLQFYYDMANCKTTFVGVKIGQKVVIDRPTGPIKQAIMDPLRRISWSLIIPIATSKIFCSTRLR